MSICSFMLLTPPPLTEPERRAFRASDRNQRGASHHHHHHHHPCPLISLCTLIPKPPAAHVSLEGLPCKRLLPWGGLPEGTSTHPHLTQHFHHHTSRCQTAGFPREGFFFRGGSPTYLSDSPPAEQDTCCLFPREPDSETPSEPPRRSERPPSPLAASPR
jgi:hypothetical protein